jgi:hypothetical protein
VSATPDKAELITAIEALLVKFFPVIGGVSTVALLPLAAIAEPFVAAFLEKLAEADRLTKEQGWHYVIPYPGQPGHEDGIPYITRDAVVIVSDTPTPPEGGTT